MYQAPRGTSDILPQQQVYFKHIADKASLAAYLYGYERIDTPVFEDFGLFSHSIGEETEIVVKEMYVFKDKGDKVLALRPEGTAPLCRAYIEHGMGSLPQPVRLYYFASAFRYERPQAGRYRQHHQFGFEAIGDADPALDVEIIDLAWQLYTSLGIDQLSLYLNSIGCKACRPGYVQALKDYYSPQLSQLCPDCQARWQRNPLRLLDCKQPACQEKAVQAPQSLDHLCVYCRGHFAEVKRHLEALGLPYTLNPRLVRGLDYYTNTVFEIQLRTSSLALGGGGRYDNLIEQLGGKPTPAVGFATGVERIIGYLKEHGIPVPPSPRPEVAIVYLGEAAKSDALKLASELRSEKVAVLLAAGGRSLKGQLRHAGSLGARYVLIVAEDEMRSGTVTLRDMSSHEQKSVPRGEIARFLSPKSQPG
ncbi:MAG: histidine--tRNA ligase [Chloroflexota bacterium]